MGNTKIATTNYLKSCHQSPTSLTSWNHLLRFFLKTDPDSAGYALQYGNAILTSYSVLGAVDIYVENLYLEGLYFYCNELLSDGCRSLMKALHLQPKNPKILAALYLCQTSESSRFHIQKMLEILVNSGSKAADFLLKKIKFHFDANHLQEAKSIIKNLENSNDNDANLRLSVLFYYLGDFQKSLTFVKKYLKLSFVSLKLILFIIMVAYWMSLYYFCTCFIAVLSAVKQKKQLFSLEWG